MSIIDKLRNKPRNKLRNKLSAKFVVCFMLLGMLIILSGCLIGYLKYTEVIEKMYNDKAYAIAYTAMESIDGDLIGHYCDLIFEAQHDEEKQQQMRTDIQGDPAYQKILAVISTMRDKMEANYIYIADPTDGKGNVTATLTYLFDADNPTDNYPPFIPGDTSTMNESFLADSKWIYETGGRSNNYFYSHSAFGYNTSAIVAIQNADGKTVAYLGVELAMETLENARINYVLSVIILGTLFTAIIIVVFLLYFDKKMLTPIKVITEEAGNFIEKETELSTKLDKINTGDEIELMSKSIYKMQSDIVNYIENLTVVTTEKERIGVELSVAKNIQSSMLPCIFPAFPDKNEFDIHASMAPAKEVGGDFYDFFLVGDNHLALVIADVSGKGVPAALFMVISKTLIKNSIQNGMTPKETLETVNNQLCENNEAGMFVTAWIGILEIPTGIMRCTNAGHEYPVIKRKDNAFELYKDKHGFVLAGIENVKYYEYEIVLHDGDKLFVYTDGVPEATNSKNELMGTDLMIKALNNDLTADCRMLLTNVQTEIDKFVGDASQFDDITMLAIELNKKNSLCVNPTTTSIKQAINFVENYLTKAAVEKKVVNQINIAVDEIYTNIVHYSGANDVEIGCAIHDEKIIVTFSDDGKNYNPLEMPEPDTTLGADERKIGGLGIFIVKKSMDEIHYAYENEKNLLTIIKRIPERLNVS